MAETWALPRALMGGTRAMRAAGTTYLPQEPAESDTAYAIRKARSTLFGGYRKTVRDMVGKVFAKPIGYGKDFPSKFEPYVENIDLAGRHLNVFAMHVFEDALQAGIGHILVDMPPPVTRDDGQPATLADEIEAGNRPYFSHIKAEDLIGWKSETINGVETLTQVRIRECVEVEDPKNRFEKAHVDQIRVLEPGRFEIWQNDGHGKWVMVQEGTTSLFKITLATVYVNRTGFMLGSPPLQDLADLNVAHWQSGSDQRNILHVARVPILFGFGIPDEAPSIQVGASSMIRTASTEAGMMFVEHSGAAIGSGRDDLKDLEGQMQAMGLELILPKPGGQSATGEAIDQAAMHAPLAIMAGALQDALEAAFAFMAEYDGLGEEGGGSLSVNTDFGVSMRDSADLQTLLAARNAGMITGATFLKELKRRGVLADDTDLEAEVESAKDDVPLGLMAAMAEPADEDEEDDDAPPAL
jgi:hypothetical protein